MTVRRIVSVFLPCLAMERWQRETARRGEPFPDDVAAVLVDETANGPVIHALNRAAAGRGIRAGARLADMRALCPDLHVDQSDRPGDAAALKRLMLWLRRWGPWSAVDGEDGLVLDATGAAHLFGGEAAMLAEIQGRMGVAGLTARLALAPTWGAAWGLARYGAERAILAGTGEGPVEGASAGEETGTAKVLAFTSRAVLGADRPDRTPPDAVTAGAATRAITSPPDPAPPGFAPSAPGVHSPASTRPVPCGPASTGPVPSGPVPSGHAASPAACSPVPTDPSLAPARSLPAPGLAVAPLVRLAPMLAALPAAALRLGPETQLLLRRLGLRTVGQVAAIPRLSMARRFTRAALEENPLLRLDQMTGRLAEPLAAPEAPVSYLAVARLAEPVQDPTDWLPGLMADLCAQLAAGDRGCRRLGLSVFRVDGDRRDITIGTAAPSREAAHLLRLFDGRLEGLDPGYGFDLITLEALAVEGLGASAPRLDGSRDEALARSRLIDRLVARFGAAAVILPEPVESHLPERAERPVPAIAARPGKPPGATAAAGPARLTTAAATPAPPATAAATPARPFTAAPGPARPATAAAGPARPSTAAAAPGSARPTTAPAGPALPATAAATPSHPATPARAARKDAGSGADTPALPVPVLPAAATLAHTRRRSVAR